MKQFDGNRLKTIREKKKLTRHDLALAVGCTREAVEKWENGKSAPGSGNFFALCEALGIKPAALLVEAER